MKRILLSLARRLTALLLGLLLGGLGAQFADGASLYRDVPSGAWYRQAAEELLTQGIMTGTKEGVFSPDATLTRAETVTILARCALSESELYQYRGASGFPDVAEAFWGSRYINWAKEAGVTRGYGNGNFGPNDPISRQEIAVLLNNFARATGRQMPQDQAAKDFSDEETIAAYALTAVDRCRRAGVITGYSDGSFRPKEKATRAEAAALFSRFLARCDYGSYKILRKRALSIPIRGVEFDPADFRADLVTGWNVPYGSEGVSSMVRRSEAVIAVNGAFFEMTDYQSWGTLIKGGQVLTVADQYAPYRPALMLDGEGRWSVQSFATKHSAELVHDDGTKTVITGITVNRRPSSDKDATRILYSYSWGSHLGFTARDAVVFDRYGTVTGVYHNQDVEIPLSGWVLAQRARRYFEGDFFDTVRVGDIVALERIYEGADTQDIQLSVGAGPRLVRDGEVYGGQSTYRQEGYADSSRALRVCAGIKPDGKLVLITCSATLQQLSQIMVVLGCREAINLDGGGSANLYVDGQWLRGPQSRPLNNMLVFCAGSTQE